jgi:acetyl esterase/lipase
LDLFYEECREYVRRLREAGVPVHEEIAPGAFHAFDQIADKAPISVKFFASQCDHLRDALALTGP